MVHTVQGPTGRSVHTLWDLPPASRDEVRARTMVLGLAGGVLLANLLAAGAVAALGPSTADSASRATAASAVGLATRAGSLPHGTQADRVVAAMVATDLGPTLGQGWTAGPVMSTPASPLLPAFCHHPKSLGSAEVFVGASRDLTAPAAGARLQVWALGAGQGVTVEGLLRQGLSDCAGVSLTDAPGFSGGTGAGFTARLASGQQWMGWAVRRRGDVLVSLTATSGTPAPWLDAATATLDSRLAALLSGTCAAQDEQPADALTNPYAAGAAYQPHTAAVMVTGPTYAATPQPAPEVPMQVTLPTPALHPELAPPTLAPVSQWLDTNHDGIPDTPVPLARAGRGAAPVYADPRLLRVPAGLVTTPPTEPNRPSAPTPLAVQTPAADPTGPGCGWAFTGQVAPHEDPQALARQAQADVKQGMVTLAAAQAAYQVAVSIWVRLEPEYRQQHAKYVAYQTITQALHDAQGQQNQAQAAYSNAVTVYEQALGRDAQPPATPTSPPSPQPSATAAAPAPAPSDTGTPPGVPATTSPAATPGAP